jgi:hypothetical protein
MVLVFIKESCKPGLVCIFLKVLFVVALYKPGVDAPDDRSKQVGLASL